MKIFLPELKRNCKIKKASLFRVGRGVLVGVVLKLPDGLEVLEEGHVCGHSCDKVRFEERHVRSIGFSQNWRKANDLKIFHKTFITYGVADK